MSKRLKVFIGLMSLVFLITGAGFIWAYKSGKLRPSAEFINSPCSIYGIVENESGTHPPVADAIASFWQSSTNIGSIQTDSEGKFSSGGLDCSKDTTVAVNKAGYYQYNTVPFHFINLAPLNAGILFIKPKNGIVGTVKDKKTSNPIPQAKIELYSGETKLQEKETDASGYYFFDNINPGTYKLTASKDQAYGAEDQEITLVVAEHKTVDFLLASLSPVYFLWWKGPDDNWEQDLNDFYYTVSYKCNQSTGGEEKYAGVADRGEGGEDNLNVGGFMMIGADPDTTLIRGDTCTFYVRSADPSFLADPQNVNLSQIESDPAVWGPVTIQ